MAIRCKFCSTDIFEISSPKLEKRLVAFKVMLLGQKFADHILSNTTYVFICYPLSFEFLKRYVANTI